MTSPMVNQILLGAGVALVSMLLTTIVVLVLLHFRRKLEKKKLENEARYINDNTTRSRIVSRFDSSGQWNAVANNNTPSLFGHGMNTYKSAPSVSSEPQRDLFPVHPRPLHNVNDPSSRFSSRKASLVSSSPKNIGSPAVVPFRNSHLPYPPGSMFSSDGHVTVERRGSYDHEPVQLNRQPSNQSRTDYMEMEMRQSKTTVSYESTFNWTERDSLNAPELISSLRRSSLDPKGKSKWDSSEIPIRPTKQSSSAEYYREDLIRTRQQMKNKYAQRQSSLPGYQYKHRYRSNSSSSGSDDNEGSVPSFMAAEYRPSVNRF